MEIEIKNTERIDHGDLRESIQSLDSYAQTLKEAHSDGAYTVPESALYTPFDEAVRKEVYKLKDEYHKVKKIFLVGIGGSDMGTRAIYASLHELEKNPERELIDFDTIEKKMIQQAQEIVATTDSPEEIVCIVISKSGTTTETIANANLLFDVLRDTYGDEHASKQTLVITGEDTPLYKNAIERNMRVFSIPKKVGGRFSVFTNAGLVPLALLGIDIDALCEGAQKAITASVSSDKPKTAAILAAVLAQAYRHEARMHELFFWNPELETLGKWYRQLLAESIGKKDSQGRPVGFTPSTAIGSTDLHSLGQLIFGGRNDRFTTFVSAPSQWHYEKPFSMHTPFTLPFFNEKNPGEVFGAIYKGVQKTYDTYAYPYISIEFSGITERELGAFMGLHMTMIMYVAQLLEVNAFNQPAVETYKDEVRKLLSH